MAMNHLLSYDHDDDDFIDMEVSSYSNFLCHSISSPPFPKEFEFQLMSTTSIEKEPSTSPADELFYKGKLLPLHLPPRLQMVEKLLENSNSAYDNGRKDTFEELFSTPLMTTATTPTTTSTPFESCNISPSESCFASRELDPDEYFFEYSTEACGFIENAKKSNWTKKLKLIKQSSLGSKLKASRAYLRSLFGRSGCSDDSCTVATKVADEATVSKAKDSLNKYVKQAAKKTPFGQIQKDKHNMSTNAMQNKEKTTEDSSARLHRRSFSMAIKRYSINESLSSSSESSSSSSSFSSSTSSSGFHRLPFLKRSSSAKSEIENPIQGAIAHCKQSQQQFHSRKTVNEINLYALSASRVSICEDQERPDLCRG